MARNGKKSNNRKLSLLNNDVTKTLEDSRPTEPPRIAFSFRFFRQIPCFELGECNNAWFTGLLSRLARISELTLTDLRQRQTDKTFRFHPINWRQKNMPIRREDIDWLTQEIKNNPDEYEFYQFSISKSSGRFIGFWGNQESNPIFYIVLFDQKHNIQPAKDYDYRVRSTHPSISQYDELQSRVNKALGDSSCKQSCKLREILQTPNQDTHILYAEIEKEYEDALATLLELHSLSDIFTYGIINTLGSADIGTHARNNIDRIPNLIELLQAIQAGNDILHT